ncbi:DEKNAAC101148 [Brettanomyces naardenensis]|uniref:DEKNAAC101148 n=1 Tax=Brettanomyces naardenensis TaxID=13370 RepID=A0A448YHD0_BRENA|nr:DEKNAAC101148 [Brettanomyces naardenensis]
MGFSRIFKAPKEMTREQGRDLLEENGVAINDESEAYKRKFKFGEFAKYTKEQGATVNQIRPRRTGREGDRVHSEERGYSEPFSEQPYSAPTGSYRQKNTYSQRESERGGYRGDQRRAPLQNSPYGNPYGAQSAPVSREKYSEGGSSGSYQPATQSSYGSYGYQNSKKVPASEGASMINGVYDPYAPEETKNLSRVGTAQPQQVQQQVQGQHYDPYAQEGAEVAADTETLETDFNRYPNAQQERAYDPYMVEGQQKDVEEVDEEEEEINRIVRQTKDVREATVKSSANVLRHLKEADDSATNTLGALGSQREKMYEMEHGMNLMDTQQLSVDEHVKDLEHYSRGLFHIKASNPFTRKSRRRAVEQRLLLQRQADRERDSELNNRLRSSQQAIIGELKEGESDVVIQSDLQDKEDYDRRVRAASKYLTDEHDKEDEEMEVDYGRNLDEAHKLARRLHEKANVISQEIASQNKGLEVISEKVNKVDDKMLVATNRIRGI